MFRNLVIVVALFGIGWGASFGAGVAFGRRSAPAAQAAAIPGAAQVQIPAGRAGEGGAAAAGQGAGQARVAAGTVERVDGQTLFLTAAQGGQQTRVSLTGQTQILRQTAGTTADLTAGATVTVQAQGAPAADGSLTAATVMIGGAGGPGIQRPGGAQAGR
ncbi:MAG: hypothetical protein ACR2NO_04940 [Chloroflexota bacterium]